ncbi:MAG: 4Fe-4S dicluster domain-containing protein [Caldilineae bacterium]|nr:4Fe-4S dicluster domain-containing protein [Caldilineae bacterium]
MQHAIPVETLGPQGQAMADAVQACVHCGFCLPACPTYRLLGEEMDSPRGRIYLMKETLEGALPLAEALPYIDHCLGCVGCVPACPSGVPYGDLITSFRAYVAQNNGQSSSIGDRIQRTLLKETLPHPGRFRAAARAGRLGRGVSGALPESLRSMLTLLPDELPAPVSLPPLVPAIGPRRARVALLAGCVQQALAPQINMATLRVLCRQGVEVVIPPGQGCCGALSMHMGEADQARKLARANLRAFPDDVDAVITNAAGCGSGIHEYPLLFRGTNDEKAASRFASQAVDVSVFLAQLGLIEEPGPLPQPLTVAYHDACHLANAQGVRLQPRDLLRRIPNLTLVEIADGELCCGSAGTYNIQQPELAGQLGEQKARNVLATGADVLVTGNIGCLTQIDLHLRRLGKPVPMMHTIELLDRAMAQPVGPIVG